MKTDRVSTEEIFYNNFYISARCEATWGLSYSSFFVHLDGKLVIGREKTQTLISYIENLQLTANHEGR
jgi:hypothetical protein